MVWTADSNPSRVIPHFKKNSPDIAKSVIRISGNKMTNGEAYICKMFFKAPTGNESNVATNDPGCILSTVSIPLTVHGRFFCDYTPNTII